MKTLFIFLAITSFSSCKFISGGGTSSEGASDMSSISLKLPAKNVLDEKVRDLITQYEIKIIPNNCASGANGKKVERISNYDTGTIGDRITQGCYYRIGLKLLGADAKAYYGNWDTYFDAESKQLNSADFMGKPTISVSVVLKPLKAAKDKGADPNKNISTPGETDATLCVEIEGQKNPDCVPGTPAAGGNAVVGACEKENMKWKTGGGGCKFFQNGLVFSAVANVNGQIKKLLGAEAVSYCDSLVEGGQSDWHLPSRVELSSIVDSEPGDILNNFASTSAHDWYWTSTPEDNVPYVKVILGGTSIATPQSPAYAICIRL